MFEMFNLACACPQLRASETSETLKVLLVLAVGQDTSVCILKSSFRVAKCICTFFLARVERYGFPKVDMIKQAQAGNFEENKTKLVLPYFQYVFFFILGLHKVC